MLTVILEDEEEEDDDIDGDDAYIYDYARKFTNFGSIPIPSPTVDKLHLC